MSLIYEESQVWQLEKTTDNKCPKLSLYNIQMKNWLVAKKLKSPGCSFDNVNIKRLYKCFLFSLRKFAF